MGMASSVQVRNASQKNGQFHFILDPSLSLFVAHFLYSQIPAVLPPHLYQFLKWFPMLSSSQAHQSCCREQSARSLKVGPLCVFSCAPTFLSTSPPSTPIVSVMMTLVFYKQRPCCGFEEGEGNGMGSYMRSAWSDPVDSSHCNSHSLCVCVCVYVCVCVCVCVTCIAVCWALP